MISEDKTLSPYRTYFSCSKNNNILSQYFKNPCHMLKPIQYLLFEQFPLLSAWDSGFLLVITFVPINFVNYFLLVIIILLVHCLGRSDTRRKRYRAVVIQGRSATGSEWQRADVLQGRSDTEPKYYRTGVLQGRSAT